MKRILLICLALLMVQSVCWAKIEKEVDKFDGSICYYVDATYYDPYNPQYTVASFTLFPDPENGDRKYLQIFLNSKTAYAIEPTIKVQIDDTIYTWDSNHQSSRRNGAVDFTFTLPANVYEALLNTNKNISLRFFYKDISGDYKQDFAIPYKKIKEVQTMYKTYSSYSANQPAN